MWQKATHTGRKSGHPPSLVKTLVTRVLPSSQRKRARRPPEQALAASSRPPCCATRAFVTRSTLAGVHSVVPADSRGVFHAPCASPCPRNPAGDTTLPERPRSSGHVMGPSPSRNTVFPVKHPGRWAARHSCVPPDMSPCHPVAQPLVSDGTIGPSALDMASGLALCSPSLSRHVYRHIDRHFYRQFYRRWDLALKLALKSALKSALHAGRRAVVDRGPGPRQSQAGRRERRHPAEASPLCQVRVWTTLFGPFTVAAWERQAPTRGAPSGSRFPAGRGGPGPFTPLRCPGFGEGSPAVTNPQKSPRFLTRSFATGRGLNFWGLVTAHSRSPRQRSRPTRESSLGLGLTSALPGGRFVGLSVARHIVLGRWRRARSRRIEGPT